MKITAIIPSRFDSSRFQGKPLAIICGKPMIQMVYERARSAKNINRVIVATDSQKIFDVVNGFGGEVVMTSDKCRSGTDRVAEAAEILRLDENDVIVNVQGDQPLMHPECIDELVRPFFDDPDIEISTLAFRIIKEKEITDPKDVKVVIDNNGDALYFSRSTIPFDQNQKENINYYKHLGFYAYTYSFLQKFRNMPAGKLEKIEKLEQLRVLEHGYKIKVIVTAHDSPEVDIPKDIKIIEEIINKEC
ncbi:MAG: 3-deoxy-manno-octulosonate cytidylyltransferase [Candidatus Cloacimonetes bacterium]|nr:3-deoxy-manno-octulosonate cytidylyltransferase [Candidatus Cloacimonadota bacterium]